MPSANDKYSQAADEVIEIIESDADIEEKEQKISEYQVRALRLAGRRLGLKIAEKSKIDTVAMLMDYCRLSTPEEKRRNELGNKNIKEVREIARDLGLVYTRRNKQTLIDSIIEFEIENGTLEQSDADTADKQETDQKENGKNESTNRNDGTTGSTHDDDEPDDEDEEEDDEEEDYDDFDSDDLDDDDYDDEEEIVNTKNANVEFASNSEHETDGNEKFDDEISATANTCDDDVNTLADNASGITSFNNKAEKVLQDMDEMLDAQEKILETSNDVKRDSYIRENESEKTSNDEIDRMTRIEERKANIDARLREAEEALDKKIEAARSEFMKQIEDMLRASGEDEKTINKVTNAKHVAGIDEGSEDDDIDSLIATCKHSIENASHLNNEDIKETHSEYEKLPDSESPIEARISVARDTLDDIIDGHKSYIGITKGDLLDERGIASSVCDQETSDDKMREKIFKTFDETIVRTEETDNSGELVEDEPDVTTLAHDVDNIKNADALANDLYNEGVELDEAINTELDKLDKNNVNTFVEPTDDIQSANEENNKDEDTDKPDQIDADATSTVVHDNKEDKYGEETTKSYQSDVKEPGAENEPNQYAEETAYKSGHENVENDYQVKDTSDYDTIRMPKITQEDVHGYVASKIGNISISEGNEEPKYVDEDAYISFDDEIEEPPEFIENNAEHKKQLKTGWTDKATNVFRKKNDESSRQFYQEETIEPYSDSIDIIKDTNIRDVTPPSSFYFQESDDISESESEPIIFDDASFDEPALIDPNEYLDTVEQVNEANPFVSVSNEAYDQAQQSYANNKNKKGFFKKLFKK